MRTVAILIVTVVALVGAFFLFSEGTAPPSPTTAAKQAPPTPKVIALTLRGGKLATGPAITRVAQGTRVVMRVESDLADAMHVHGYDLHLPLEARKPAELAFTATATGRFEYELHEHHAVLGAIEVYPR